MSEEVGIANKKIGKQGVCQGCQYRRITKTLKKTEKGAPYCVFFKIRGMENCPHGYTEPHAFLQN